MTSRKAKGETVTGILKCHLRGTCVFVCQLP